MKQILLITVLFCTFVITGGYSQVVFEFNEKGVMTSAPPGLIHDKADLNFVVHVSETYYDSRIIEFYNRYRESIKLLKIVKEKKGFYGLPNTTDVDAVIEATQGDMARQLIKLLRTFSTVFSKQMDIDKEKDLLCENAETEEVSDLNIPDIRKLIEPRYF